MFDKPEHEYKVFFNGQLYHLCTGEDYRNGIINTSSFNTDQRGFYTVDKNCKIVFIGKIEYVDLSKIILQKPERNEYKKYYYVRNSDMKHTPARIDVSKGEIQLSDEFYKLPLQIQYFIKWHEIGHFYYNTEKFADLFALYQFLKHGYNESNAFYAIDKVLSDTPENKMRTKELFNQIMKLK